MTAAPGERYASGRWLWCARPRPRADTVLLAFPHAGGSAMFFRSWGLRLPPAIEVIAVQYPGRLDRLREPCIDDVHLLADAVHGIIQTREGLTDRGLALFGHSMGAAVAFETALRLEASGIDLSALFVSSHPAPGVASRWHPDEFTDEVLLAELRRLGATPDVVLDAPQLREPLLTSLRADYRAVARYRPRRGARLRCPVVTLVGDADPDVAPARMHGWAAVTTGAVTAHEFEGGHFYLTPRLDTVLDTVAAHLSPFRGRKEGAVTLPPKFDMHDPATIDDPYPAYAALRAAGPLGRGGPGQWLVPRHADVSALMSDPRLSGSFSADHHALTIGRGPASEFFRRVVLNQDPPDHTRVRRLMGHAISPSLAHTFAPRIGELVDELLAPALDGDRFDAVTDLGYPLPLRVLGELIGIDPADLAEVGIRAIDVSKAFANMLNSEERIAAHGAVVWLYDYIAGLLDARRADPRGDLLSRLLAAEHHGDRLTEREIIENVIFLLFAGFETTTSLVAGGCKALLNQPEQLRRLTADPALARSAVEEFLRFDAPIQVKLRLVLEPISFAGRVLRTGRVVVLLLGSANRDERLFTAPDEVDITRDPNRHLSFGGGHHHCIGAALARAEATAVFEWIGKRVRALEPAGRPVLQRRPGFRCYQAVPVRMVPA